MNSDNETPPSSSVFWDESGQPVSRRFNDVYFSKESGIDESRYVFIEQNHLTRRWRESDPEGTFLIGETGFGTGLNFLTTWAHWNKFKPGPNARLHFFSVEKYPLTKHELTNALALWPELQPLSTTLIAHYPPNNVRGNHRLVLENNHLYLTIYFGDAVEGLAQLIQAGAPVNAWYLDGFAPAKNPDMWSDDLFSHIAQLSAGDTTFSTFTAAGVVRRGLKKMGFHCEKIKGFGRKREMLVGRYHLHREIESASNESKSRTASTIPRWCAASKSPEKKISSALIVGGGLAGCHTAFVLANRGIKVTILEQEKQLAEKGSGNRQGVVYTKLSPHPGALSDFNLYAQIYANHFYSINSFFDRCGSQCGVIHFAVDKKTVDGFIALGETFQTDADFARFIPEESTKQIAGLKLRSSGLHMEKAGWLNPVTLCQILTEHSNIEVVTDFPVARLDYSEEQGQWRARDRTNKKVIADIAVIANARDALQFDPCRHLPLKTIRGQVSHIPANNRSGKLHCAVCGEGYIAPAVEGIHYCGATYRLNSNDIETTIEEHEENIRNVAGLSEDLEFGKKLAPTISGRAAFRCTTPDYFPIVGPAPVFRRMQEEFAFLRKKATATINNNGHYYPGLYLNLGYGSRGLAYAPLCAELLASLICFEPLPVSGKIVPYLHPARFIIRDLQRNRI